MDLGLSLDKDLGRPLDRDLGLSRAREPGLGVRSLRGDLSRGDRSRDLGVLSLRGDLSRGDLSRGDLSRGDLSRGDLSRGSLSRGDLSRGVLSRRGLLSPFLSHSAPSPPPYPSLYFLHWLLPSGSSFTSTRSSLPSCSSCQPSGGSAFSATCNAVSSDQGTDSQLTWDADL